MNTRQAQIQNEAFRIWDKTGNGTLAMCTGSGKSRVGIMAHKKYPGRNLLLVPTEKLRDVDWRKEFEKWGEDYSSITAMCYASAYKIKGEHYDLVIADEIHNGLSDEYRKFFKNNTYDRILGLSATIESDRERILDELKCPIVFQYTLTQAIEEKVVSPYQITLIYHTLDNKHKNIKAGSKSKGYFMQTEAKQYEFITRKINKLRYAGMFQQEQFAIFERMRFLYNLPSKIPITKNLIDKLKKDKKRIVLFSESTKSLDQITRFAIHSNKKSDRNDEIYEKFNNKKISIIGAAKKIKEGANLTEVDALIIHSYNGRLLNTVQRIGRAIRWREGHVADIYVIVTLNTQEESWMDNLTNEGLDLREPVVVRSKDL
jgi:superfamily II DNA or RNA helicase